MNKALLRSVARGLRYRPLEHLIGRSVWIRDLTDVETAIRSALRTNMPADCHLIDSEPQYREGAVAKYGILDLKFSASTELLGEKSQTGIPLLRDLGFLPTTKGERTDNVCHAPICLEMLQEDLGEKQTYLLLFLTEGGLPLRLWMRRFRHVVLHRNDERCILHDLCFRVPPDYLPRSFRIIDAWVTNASSVWLQKHFYF